MASFNKVILIGRLTADPELKTTQSGIPVVSFSVAVDRRYTAGEEKKADFFPVVCWRKTAEFAAKYFTKGKSILIEGQLQNRSYTANDGSKRSVTEVIADGVNFVEGAEARLQNGDIQGIASVGLTAGRDENGVLTQGDFIELGEDDDLPF